MSVHFEDRNNCKLNLSFHRVDQILTVYFCFTVIRAMGSFDRLLKTTENIVLYAYLQRKTPLDAAQIVCTLLL